MKNTSECPIPAHHHQFFSVDVPDFHIEPDSFGAACAVADDGSTAVQRFVAPCATDAAIEIHATSAAIMSLVTGETSIVETSQLTKDDYWVSEWLEKTHLLAGAFLASGCRREEFAALVRQSLLTSRFRLAARRRLLAGFAFNSSVRPYIGGNGPIMATPLRAWFLERQTAADVFARRYWFQVIRIEARLVTAEMVQMTSGRDWAAQSFVHDAMDILFGFASSVDVNGSIPLAEMAFKDPTSISLGSSLHGDPL